MDTKLAASVVHMDTKLAASVVHTAASVVRDAELLSLDMLSTQRKTLADASSQPTNRSTKRWCCTPVEPQDNGKVPHAGDPQHRDDKVLDARAAALRCGAAHWRAAAPRRGTARTQASCSCSLEFTSFLSR
jgi:hypothetical protein